MIAYKLKRLSDGKFYSGCEHWTRYGKAWTRRNHVSCAYHAYKQPPDVVVCIMTPTSYEEIPAKEFFNV